ncbi:MAG TPA: purine-nucleoside phosphorylase [Clostridiales bacterium]|jgi:purine-nucleoside phosphorylase|nr:purine-nucleoside phosphorylase [Clostridiales bacterium]
MTIHIGAKKGEIAETILLPGDPLRARFLAEKYLDDVFCYNEVRGIYGYTGYYKGKRISVQGTGMGMPSIGIYSHELIVDYNVKNLIRIGSCGSFRKEVKVRDVILAMSASTNSNFASQFGLPGTYAPTASYALLEKAKRAADEKNIPVVIGNILSSDIFYDADPNAWKKWAALGVLGVEMEAAALYMHAAKLGANALAILTVSDSLVDHSMTTSEEREKTLTDMMEIALELA